jgi:hypothetical protein
MTKKIIGGALIIGAFIAIIVVIGITMGWGTTLASFGIAIIISALIAVGAYLLTDE